jgi:hypothetical protein
MSLVEMSFQEFTLVGQKLHAKPKFLLRLDFVVPAVNGRDRAVDLDANRELALDQAASQHVSGCFGSDCGPSKHQHTGSYGL